MSFFALLLFILIPAVEIWLFIEVGAWLGGAAVFLLILATAFFGLSLIRRQGAASLAHSLAGDQAHSPSPQDALNIMGRGLFFIMAGFLLLIPGFFTDIMGLLLLLPPARHFLGAFLLNRLVPMDIFSHMSGFYPPPPPEADTANGDIIDADFTISDPPPELGQNELSQNEPDKK